MSPRSFASVALLALCVLSSAQASSFLADTTDDSVDANPGDGLCLDASGRCSLRAAIEEANALPGADSIQLLGGVYTLTIAGTGEDGGATGDLDITDDVTIEGAGADKTRVDGGALDRVFDLFGGVAVREVRVEGLTVQNGLLANTGLDTAGAALRVAIGVHVRLEDVVLRGNTLTQSFGGVAIDSQGCIEGERVRILDNGAPDGGSVAAVHLHEEDDTDIGQCFTLEDSEISGNAGDWAGAIDSEFVPITLKRSLVSDNDGGFAGALLLNMRADTLLENVTISGNRGNPGAILNDGGSHLVLVNSTVTANGAQPGATAVVGGIQDVHGGFGLTFLSNTIIAGNGPGFLADDCDAASSVGGGNLIGDVRCHFDADPNDQLGVDPGLGPLADNGGLTWTHLPGTAAIDRGRAAACPPADQRALPRPADGDGDGIATCDAGAVEVQRETIFASGFDA
ncbi:MAG TPA: right-handed parallel beta-helix repeat-containing protein [Rhodanobacteraceae bacterium]|nr:right-handed parallel beta-helix repeat-containing protein [Rhodanobacteraceae bacterium]